MFTIITTQVIMIRPNMKRSIGYNRNTILYLFSHHCKENVNVIHHVKKNYILNSEIKKK